MHGAKGGAKLRRRLTKILATIKAANGGGRAEKHGLGTSFNGIGVGGGVGVGVGSGGATTVGGVDGAWPSGPPASKRPKIA